MLRLWRFEVFNLIHSTEFVESLYTLFMVDIDEMVVRG